MDGKNAFKQTEKDKAFEDLIKELRPLLRQSKELNYGTSSQAKESTNHTLELNFKGYQCIVQLK